MKKFYGFKKVRVGTHDPEGDVWISADGIIAIEPNGASGGRTCFLTMQGGRSVHVDVTAEQVRAVLGKARRPTPSNHDDRMFDFMRDFFGLRRA